MNEDVWLKSLLFKEVKKDVLCLFRNKVGIKCQKATLRILLLKSGKTFCFASYGTDFGLFLKEHICQFKTYPVSCSNDKCLFSFNV